MGESQPSTPAPNVSPGRNRSSTSLKMGLNSAEPKNLRQKLFNQSDLSYQSPYTNRSEKQGPPRQGLFDTIESKKLGSPLLHSTGQNFGNSFNDSVSRINDSLNYSQTINDSFRSTANSRSDGNETLWVTVFGFPPSALTLVLAHFSNCGTIVEKKCPTQGNWVHLKFNSFNEVSRALAFNGKLVTNGVMVGVVPYSNKQGNKENLENSVFSPAPRARSLRRSVVTLPNSNQITSPQNVPQRSTGLVTKAMEYVFGW